MGRGGGQRGVEGFLKGSERPEAGCLGEYFFWSLVLIITTST